MKSTNKAAFFRRLRYGGVATAVTVAVIAAAVLLNVIVGILNDHFPLNLDLSGEKYYSLSDESRDLIHAIDQDVSVVVFGSESTYANPAASSTAETTVLMEVYALLGQYASESGGRIKTQYIDINNEPTKYAAYKDYGVSEMDILMLSGTKSKTITYFDLFVSEYPAEQLQYYLYYYGASMDSLVTGSRVEKALATGLMTVCGGANQTVTLLTGHSEDEGVTAGLRQVYEANGYTVEELNLSTAAEFNPDAVVAIVPAPTADFSDDEIARLRAWLENDGAQGRNLMAFINYAGDCPNLYEFLQVEYGIEVTDRLVYESDLNRVYYYNPFYAFVDVAESDLTAGFAGTANVFGGPTRQLVLTYGNEEEEQGNSMFTTPLLTSPESAQLIPLEDAMNATEENEPTPENADTYPIVSAAMTTKIGNTSGDVTNVAVFGGSYVAYADFITTDSLNNEELLLGLTNDLAGVDFNVSVSTKVLSERVEFSGGTAIAVGVGVFTVGLPVALLIVGLVVFLRRRHL